MMKEQIRGVEAPKNQLEVIQAIVRDITKMVEGANACDRAYAEGTGHPDWYSAFDADSAEKVAQNYAGLQAVMSGIGMLCSKSFRNLDITQDAKAVLQDIVNGNLMPEEKDMLHRTANATWGAGQPFRTDKGPLGRAGNVNMFDTLPQEEVAKDWHQIKAAAEFFLKYL